MSYRQVITYGTLTLPFNTMDMTQTPIFAPDGLTLEGIEQVFNVSGYIVANTPALLGTQLCAAKAQLSLRQQPISVIYYDSAGIPVSTLVSVTGGDDRGGPIPGPFRTEKFIGGVAVKYSWSVTVFLKECISNDTSCTRSARPTDILSVTQAFSHHVDIDGLTTRTVTGKLLVSQNAVESGFPADSYRNEVDLPIPVGFRRVGYDFQQDESGRMLSYTIVDEELADILPDPVTGGDVDYSISIDPTGMLCTYHMSGYVSAPYSVSKETLINIVFGLVQDRIPQTAPGGGLVVYTTRTIGTNLLKNRVNFTFEAQAPIGAGAGAPDFKSGVLDTFNKIMTPGGVAHPIGPYGGDAAATSGVSASAPGPYDACEGTDNTIPTVPPDNGQPVDDGSGQGANGNDQPVVPGANPGASDGHLTNPYLAFHEQLHFQVDNGLSVYVPKNDGQAAFPVRSRATSMIVIQAGYFVRYGTVAGDVTDGIPKPVLLQDDTSAIGANAVLLRSSINPESPEPVGDGSVNRYTIHWEYVMQTTRPISGVPDLFMQFPQDKRRTPESQFVLLPDNLLPAALV